MNGTAEQGLTFLKIQIIFIGNSVILRNPLATGCWPGKKRGKQF